MFTWWLQALRGMARQVQGIRDLRTLVSRFDRKAYTIPESKRLRPGWRNLREFIRIDHPNPQAKAIIDNKLMDEVGGRAGRRAGGWVWVRQGRGGERKSVRVWVQQWAGQRVGTTALVAVWCQPPQQTSASALGAGTLYAACFKLC